MHTFVWNVSHVLESRVRSCVCVFEEGPDLYPAFCFVLGSGLCVRHSGMVVRAGRFIPICMYLLVAGDIRVNCSEVYIMGSTSYPVDLSGFS